MEQIVHVHGTQVRDDIVSRKRSWGFIKMVSEKLSQNRTYRRAPLRVTKCAFCFAMCRVLNVVITPNTSIVHVGPTFDSTSLH